MRPTGTEYIPVPFPLEVRKMVLPGTSNKFPPKVVVVVFVLILSGPRRQVHNS